MATHLSLSAFTPSTANWQLYMDQLNYCLIANDIATDKKKVAVLLSACGPATFKTICSLVDAESLSKTIVILYHTPLYNGTSSAIIIGKHY